MHKLNLTDLLTYLCTTKHKHKQIDQNKSQKNKINLDPPYAINQIPASNKQGTSSKTQP